MVPSEGNIRELLGDPHEIERDLRSFRRTAHILSTDHPRLIDRYPKLWVAAYKGRVRATGRTLRSVLNQVESEGLPKDKVIVRFIDKTQRTLIL